MIALVLALLLKGPPVGLWGCEIQRDSRGNIARDHALLARFKRLHPCPAGKGRGACPDWRIDHIAPLCAGGCDDIRNLQWEELAASKVKDQWERELCRGGED